MVAFSGVDEPVDSGGLELPYFETSDSLASVSALRFDTSTSGLMDFNMLVCDGSQSYLDCTWKDKSAKWT